VICCAGASAQAMNHSEFLRYEWSLAHRETSFARGARDRMPAAFLTPDEVHAA